jgi:hypothetical protein
MEELFAEYERVCAVVGKGAVVCLCVRDRKIVVTMKGE